MTTIVDSTGIRSSDRRSVVDIGTFSAETFPDVALRDYQIAPAQAIIESVLQQRGEQHAVVFSRQAGKDELLAQMVCFLLAEHEEKGGSIILAAPTFKPQGETIGSGCWIVCDRLNSEKPPISVNGIRFASAGRWHGSYPRRHFRMCADRPRACCW